MKKKAKPKPATFGAFRVQHCCQPVGEPARWVSPKQVATMQAAVTEAHRRFAVKGSRAVSVRISSIQSGKWVPTKVMGKADWEARVKQLADTSSLPNVPRQCVVQYRVRDCEVWAEDTWTDGTSEVKARGRCKELYHGDNPHIADVRCVTLRQRRGDKKYQVMRHPPPTDDDSALVFNLTVLLLSDVDGLLKARGKYGDSCLKRGGVGLFMNLARKWDRLELAASGNSWDLLKAWEREPLETGVIDDVRDLRRYLLLVENAINTRRESQRGGRMAGVSPDPAK